MGRKHKHEEHENHERWLVSYADFITLLFATFTALYAISTAKLADFEEFAKAVSQGFHEQSLIHGVQSILEGQSASSDKSVTMIDKHGIGEGVVGAHDSMTYEPGTIKSKETIESLQKTVEQLNQEIEKLGGNPGGKDPDAKYAGPIGPDVPPNTWQGEEKQPPRGAQLSVQERGIKVSFDSSLFFGPGNATLQPEAKKVLDKVAKRLEKFKKTNLIHIEGHTDSEPIFSALFPSNWELSTARASRVVRYFIKKHKFDPENMAAIGYGDSRPVATNKTVEGRAKNRRIDIILYSKKGTESTDPVDQSQKEVVLIQPKTPKLKKTRTKLIRSEDKEGQGRRIRVIFKPKEDLGLGPATKVIPNNKPVIEPEIKEDRKDNADSPDNH